MSRKAQVISSIVVVIAVVLAGVFVGFILQNRSNGPSGNKTNSQGLPVSGNILPDAQTLPFDGAYLELFAPYAPAQSTSLQVVSEHNVSPVLSVIVNSTGNVSALLPISFLAVAAGWAQYFSAGGQNGSETSFGVQVTYDYQINSSAMKVYSYSDFLPYNPETVTASFVLHLNLHPDLAGRPYLVSVNGTPYSQFASGALNTVSSGNTSTKPSAASPSRICPPSGCAQCDYYVWYLWNSTSYNNANLPIVWANNTGTAGNSILIPGVTMVAENAQTGFNAGE